jgi:uncharacterized protein YbjT (DUF2867 family)
MLSGPIPARVLRAAQFHEFVAELVEWGRNGDVSYVPKMRTQVVAAHTVAEALAGLATEPDPASSNGAEPLEIAGPREERLAELATLLLARRGDATRVEERSDPEDPDREINESGGLLPGANATLAGPTFEEWAESN